MVFDIEESKQLVNVADAWLSNKPLALTDGALSEVSEETSKSNSGKVSFID
jgi:hypothetical protein